jgi:hypothetical protein
MQVQDSPPLRDLLLVQAKVRAACVDPRVQPKFNPCAHVAFDRAALAAHTCACRIYILPCLGLHAVLLVAKTQLANQIVLSAQHTHPRKRIETECTQCMQPHQTHRRGLTLGPGSTAQTTPSGRSSSFSFGRCAWARNTPSTTSCWRNRGSTCPRANTATSECSQRSE